MLFHTKKVLILNINTKGYIMKYAIRFIISIIAIISLFYVGVTLIITPEQADITHYLFVVCMLAAILYQRHIEKTN